jgi:peptide/nickel transport system permease protein
LAWLVWPLELCIEAVRSLGARRTLTWGQMLHEAFTQGAVINRLWWWALPPGLAIALTGLSFALLGIALERVLRPRTCGL